MFPIDNLPFAAQLMFPLVYVSFQLLILMLYDDIDRLKAFYILCEEGDIFLCRCRNWIARCDHVIQGDVCSLNIIEVDRGTGQHGII